ncbi:MAG: hypothetical protein K2K06_09970 [Oscillospiraceae bacterium]|nr:hypothetical protein [Oscillospiraceae bacterium]
MSEENKETRIVIVHKPESDNISVCINNPHIDKNELLMMMSAHVSHFIRNIMLNGVPFVEATATAQKAVTIATDKIIGELVEEHNRQVK